MDFVLPINISSPVNYIYQHLLACAVTYIDGYSKYINKLSVKVKVNFTLYSCFFYFIPPIPYWYIYRYVNKT